MRLCRKYTRWNKLYCASSAWTWVTDLEWLIMVEKYLREKLRIRNETLRQFFAEFLGTFILIVSYSFYPNQSPSVWRKRRCPLNWPHCMHVCIRPCWAVRATVAAVAGERSCARACTCVLRFTPIFPIIGVINHKYQCIKIGSLAALSFAGVCWSKFLHL